ncbi:MAG TPA: ABC transporter substrate-binding protein [Chloroflexota bacterium]|nr:ABC transporter substrate-binding protein [Chloroflexota bacterium]
MTKRIARRTFVGLAAGAMAAACAPAPAPTSTPAAPPKAAAPAEAPKPAAPAAAAPTGTPAPAAAPAAKPTEPAAPAKPAAGAKSVFNYAEAGDFNDFNPWTYTAVNNEMYNQVFSRLTWKDGTGKINPDIASEWQMAADNLSVRFKLRENVKWHDGKPLTADDFVTMWGYTKDEALAKVNGVLKIKGITAPIKDMVAADKYTLQLKFDQPAPFVFDILDWFYAVRVDDKSDFSFLKKLPIGTGPFKATEWVANQYARFPRNPDYYNPELPRLDEFMFKRLTSAETMLPNLKSGTLDGILMTSLADVAPLQADKNYTIDVNESSGSFFNIQVNVTKPPLDKKEVRQALSYSLNREEMVKSAFFGICKPIASPFFAPTSLGYREELVLGHKFDLDKARKLLDDAGVKNLDLTIVVTPAWPQMKLFSLIWQQDLKKIGLNLKINDVENAKFYEINTDKNLQGNDLEAWLNARVTRDPAIFWSTQRNYRGGPINPFGFVNAEMEKLVAEGAVEPDTEKRRKIYQRLNEIILEESHVLQVATNPRLFAYGKGVSGVRTDLSGNLVMDQATVTR